MMSELKHFLRLTDMNFSYPKRRLKIHDLLLSPNARCKKADFSIAAIGCIVIRRKKDVRALMWRDLRGAEIYSVVSRVGFRIKAFIAFMMDLFAVTEGGTRRPGRSAFSRRCG